MDWYPILIIAHIVGTVLGVGGATFAELNVIRALRDGRVSRDEKGLMHGGYAVLRLGFFILLVSGFGLLVYYRLNGMEEMLYEPKLWAKLTIVGLIGINAVLLQLRVVPLLWGSAISLTSWYAALIIGSLHEIAYSYFGLLAMYAAAVVIVHVTLRKLHRRFTKLS